MNGQEQMQSLVQAGFNSDEIAAWKTQQAQKLSAAGFSEDEVSGYFGDKTPDIKPAREFFSRNFEKVVASVKGDKTSDRSLSDLVTGDQPKPGMSFEDYLDAGYQGSVTGLLKRGKMPDKVTPEDAPLWGKLLTSLGQVGGDLPAMLAGAWAGGETGAAAGVPVGAAIGSAIPLAGTAAGAATGATGGALIGGGAGAFALPAYLRRMLVTQYQKGEVKSASDFWGRQAQAFMEAYQQAEVGAATMGVGGIVGKAVAQPVLSTAAKLASETATMVTLGKTVEGQLPQPQDFITAGALVAGLHIAGAGAGLLHGDAARLIVKTGDIYAKTGTMPTDLAKEARANPVVRQEVASDNIAVPAAYADKVDPAQAIEPPKPANVSMAMRAPVDIGGSAGDVAILRDNTEAKAGAGRAYFHGTNTEFDAFDLSKSKDGLIHLSSDKDEALNMASKGRQNAQVLQFEANLKNVLDTDANPAEYQRMLKERAEAGGTREWLEKNGYDGMSQFEGRHLIVLDPANVKRVQPATKEPEASSVAAGGGNPSDIVGARIATSEESKKSMTLSGLYTAALDDLHPIKQLRDLLAGDKPVEVKDDPYVLARLTRGSYGRADQFLEHSPFKFDTLKNTGKSLSKVLDPVRDDADGFRSYAVARRAVELSDRGIETGVPIDAAKAMIAGGGKYSAAFKGLQAFQRSTLEYLRDSGLLSADGFEKMTEANKDYVPFYRLMDEKGGAGSPGKGLSVRAPVKRIKGSERQIIDPIESIVKNTYLYIQLAERNRALTAMANLADTAGDTGKALMERVPTPLKPVTVSEPEVAKFMKDNGVEGEPSDFTIFRAAPKRLADDEIALYRDGKMETYRVAPEVATSVRALDQQSMSLLMKMMAAPARLLRAGVTLSPEFAARNFIRDQLTAFNLGKLGFKPIYDTIRGVGSIFKKDDEYQNWLKSGGANSAMVSIDRNYIQTNVLKLSQETGFLGHTWNVIKSPLEGLKMVSELIENATRLGEFKRLNDGSADPNSILGAGFGSREITLDFQRIGAKTRAWNMITAFWNPAMQGIDKTMRTFAERPLETTLKLGASVTLPSVLLWYANHDDPRWKEIPNWQKDLFWIMFTKDHIYRIPKPMELGIVFGSLPERILDAYHDKNPDAFKDLSSDLLGALTPNYLPTFAIPVIEQFANKSTFTGNPIIPKSLEGILPEYQYTDYTTESGKMLGKLAATVPGLKDSQLASPAVIENYVRAWSGTMGMYALKIADQALIKSGAVPDPVKASPTLADIPVIKAFVVRYPSAGAQSIQDFYDRYDKAQERINTVHYLAKQGDFNAAMKEMQLAQQSELWMNLTGIKNALGTQSRFIQLVNQNASLKPDEKRQIIDGSYYMMIKVTSQGNELLKALNTQIKQPIAAPSPASDSLASSYTPVGSEAAQGRIPTVH